MRIFKTSRRNARSGARRKIGKPRRGWRGVTGSFHRARTHGNYSIERNFCAPHANFQDFPPQCTVWRKPENREARGSSSAAQPAVPAVHGHAGIARMSAVFARPNADFRDFPPQYVDWRRPENQETRGSMGAAQLIVSAVRERTRNTRLSAIFAQQRTEILKTAQIYRIYAIFRIPKPENATPNNQLTWRAVSCKFYTNQHKHVESHSDFHCFRVNCCQILLLCKENAQIHAKSLDFAPISAVQNKIRHYHCNSSIFRYSAPKISFFPLQSADFSDIL